MRQMHGVIPPVITPFTADGGIAYPSLATNLEKWNRTDLSGYLILGSNSEFVYLTEEEKIRVLEFARERIPREKAMIAGTGCEATAATISLTRRAAAIGADSVMVVTPAYYKPQMRDVPQFTGVVLSPQVVAPLAEHQNIVGMKDSAGNLSVFAEYLRQTPPEFTGRHPGPSQLLARGLSCRIFSLPRGKTARGTGAATQAPPGNRGRHLSLRDWRTEGGHGHAGIRGGMASPTSFAPDRQGAP
jgi:dihydrodipicolinate synthase/N-acetylneuraminate lyase